MTSLKSDVGKSIHRSHSRTAAVRGKLSYFDFRFRHLFSFTRVLNTFKVSEFERIRVFFLLLLSLSFSIVFFMQMESMNLLLFGDDLGQTVARLTSGVGSETQWTSKTPKNGEHADARATIEGEPRPSIQV